MRKAELLLATLLLVLFLVACAPKSAQSPAPQSPAPAAAPAPAPAAAPASVAPARPAWEENWEKTVVAAKKEGTLVLYTGFGGQLRQIITNPFASKYGVPIEAVSGTQSVLTPKISAEQRAGIYSGDVWLSGSTVYRDLTGLLDSLEPALILPELTEPELVKKTWYFGEVPWANKAHTWLIGLMYFQEPIAVNINLVKAGEITAYRNLLDPKWKGKISLNDPRVGGMGNMWFSVVLELGDVDTNYMRELVTKQELYITRDQRLQVDWLARGKHAIAIGPANVQVVEFIGLGAPVGEVNPGTPFVSGSMSGIGIAKGAPHPNAAKLFINWLLSQEGQTFLSRANGAQSQRLDVPNTHLRPSKVLAPGLKLYRSDNEDFAPKRSTVYLDLAKEVFGP